MTHYITKYIFTLVQEKLQLPLLQGIFSILKYHNGHSPIQNFMLALHKPLGEKSPK